MATTPSTPNPFSPPDVQALLHHLLDDPVCSPFIDRLFPDRTPLYHRLASVHSVDRFQTTVMREQVQRIIDTTTDGLSVSCSHALQPDKPYLFVANHRDITLDAMLLDYALVARGFTTPYVIFGANLLRVPLLADLGPLNKMVSMARGGSPRDFYRALSDTSHFIHDAVTRHHQSVWIAQRNGRTKDGDDRTDPAVIKMLSLAAPPHTPLADALAPLAIVPVTISYEWEPCDLLKVHECCAPQPYVKSPDDDLISVVTGITQPKGHVALSLADPIAYDALAACHDDPRAVAALLDEAIRGHYTLHPSNRAAHHLLKGLDDMPPQLRQAADELQRRMRLLDTADAQQALLRLYARPTQP